MFHYNTIPQFHKARSSEGMFLFGQILINQSKPYKPNNLSKHLNEEVIKAGYEILTCFLRVESEMLVKDGFDFVKLILVEGFVDKVLHDRIALSTLTVVRVY